jgi:hypothetical protein
MLREGEHLLCFRLAAGDPLEGSMVFSNGTWGGEAAATVSLPPNCSPNTRSIMSAAFSSPRTA